ncbi:MAG: hypothetical protein D6822_06995 [Cyanobacteria bacterium J149]|nr:MAG: hypothetical protein D6822_06995 [Cyanobacteria bacterium J149]
MKKIDQPDQFYEAVNGDIKLQKTLISYADHIDEMQRQIVWDTYNDPVLKSEYRSLRAYNSLAKNGMTKEKTMREIVRIPAGPVYQFLHNIFAPLYGPKWMRNKKVLHHELVKPWWVVERI